MGIRRGVQKFGIAAARPLCWEVAGPLETWVTTPNAEFCRSRLNEANSYRVPQNLGATALIRWVGA